MIKRMKKGFTIVELVIVIAVIAVLTAILVPTFISISNKADKASDQSLVKNLNTALAIQEQEPGDTKNNTLHDAVEDLKIRGYLLPNLVTKSEDKLLWNQETNRFILEGDDKQGYADIKFWRIQDSIEEDQKYSVYAGVNFKCENGVVDVKVGFDAGYKENITLVNYVRAASSESDKQTVTIRTNNGDLFVNAPNDTVHHYAALDKLDVQAIDTASYHEHGYVRVSMSVDIGHVVVEETGYVNELALPEGTNASVDIQPQGQVNTVVMDSETATVNAKQGSTVNQIVGDTENISGAGAAEAKETAITKTLVYNTAATGKLTLKQALEGRNPYIVFAEDISVAKWDGSTNVGANLTYDVVLDGDGHKLTTTASRGIWVSANDVSASIKNLVLEVKGTSSNPRGIQVNGGVTGVELAVDSVTILKGCDYAFNVCDGAEVTLTLTNSKITAWGAMNFWSADYEVYVSNCELNGVNDKNYNAEGWNNFATIILEGDTTKATDMHSSDITIDIKSTKITASTSKQGNIQSVIGFNTKAKHNTVSFSGCEIVTEQPDFKGYNFGTYNAIVVDGASFEAPQSTYFSF